MTDGHVSIGSGVVEMSEALGSNTIVYTWTAADIAARWTDLAAGAAMELAGIPADSIVFLIYVDDTNTLDQGAAVVGTNLAYESGATTDDVMDNGEMFDDLAAFQAIALGTYRESGGSVNGSVSRILAGASVYAYVPCSAPPTTGTTTVRAIFFPPNRT